jgi:hypothetical protein
MSRVKPNQIDPLTLADAVPADGTYGLGVAGGVVTGLAAVAGGGVVGAWVKTIDLPLTTLTGWTAGTGTWTVSAAGIRQALTANTVYRDRYSAARIPLAELVVEAQIRVDVAPNTTSSRAGFVFGAPWGADGTGGLLCALQVTSAGFVTAVNWEYDTITGGPSVLLPSPIALGTFITFRVYKCGSDVTAWVNGTLIGTGVIDQPNREQGSFTLYSYAADATYKNLKIWHQSVLALT